MAEEDEKYSSVPYGAAYKKSKKIPVPKGSLQMPKMKMPSIKTPSLVKEEREEREKASRGNSSRAEKLAMAAFILAVISLALAVSSFQGSGLGAAKAEIKAIASNLRAIQAKDIIVSSPLQTTIEVDERIPLSEVFSQNFRIPINFNLQLPEEVTAISSTGQAASFKFGQVIPISQDIRIDTSSTKDSLHIKKQIPVKMNIKASVSVEETYGSELDDIISRLERIGN